MKQVNDYLWKGVLEDIFDDFLRFMHPNADEIFDFGRADSYITEFLGTKLEYRYNVYKISQQSETELLQSANPFAMVVLTVQSVLKNKRLDDAVLMEIKLKLARRFLAMLLPKEKIRMLMNFLKTYVRFENSENNIIFDREFIKITGKEQTMGLEELILTTECKRARMEGEKRGERRGEKRGEKRGINQVIMNMLRKNLTNEMIADFANVPIDYVQEMRISAAHVE